MSDNISTLNEEVAEARLRRLLNQRFGSDAPVGLDWLALIEEVDARIQELQRSTNAL